MKSVRTAIVFLFIVSTFTAGLRAASTNSTVQWQSSAASNDLWIPACGAWLGAEVTNGSAKAFTDEETRIGRHLDIIRIYHTPGSWTKLTSEELNYINAGRKLLLSLKPASRWQDAVGVANGGSALVDAKLTSLAKSIASVKPRKVMLIVWHEPENDVIGSVPKAYAGTTNQYVAMWHNVRSIFDANGATNVIWVRSIENYAPLRKYLSGLWPGNAYVGWIGWDVYQGSASDNYIAQQTKACNFMVTNSNPTHNYLSKPWAWTEWGVGINKWYPTVAQQTNTFNAVNAAINANQFPNVRYVAYFDVSGSSAPNATSAILSGAQSAYNAFANSPYMTQRCSP